jgi:hypothetical protein
VKRLLALTVVLLCVAAPVLAQTLTPADRDAGLKYLETTRQGVIDATKGLSDAQWNFKPAPDRWSIAEVTEHIAAAEDLLFGMITTQVMKAPARTGSEDVKAVDQIVLSGVPDRSQKRQAPEPLKPSNRFGSPAASLQHFLDSRSQTVAFLQKTDDLRAHATDSPLGKKLDGYEWIVFIAAHSERHTKQINEVKADPNFPR